MSSPAAKELWEGPIVPSGHRSDGVPLPSSSDGVPLPSEASQGQSSPEENQFESSVEEMISKWRKLLGQDYEVNVSMGLWYI